MVNFSDPEGYIDSSDDPPLPDGAFLHCTYTVTVYTGYGVELQVMSLAPCCVTPERWRADPGLNNSDS